MNVAPTWDLFLIVLFIVVLAYSFIVRASGTAKIILSTYVSLLAADGLGNLVYQHFAGPEPTIRLLNLSNSPQTVIAIKIFFFVGLIVFLAIKGSFESGLAEESGGMMNLLITGVLGMLNAGLIASALLVYMSGGSFITGIGFASSDLAMSIYENSMLARIMIDNASLWVSLPAMAFLATSMMTSE